MRRVWASLLCSSFSSRRPGFRGTPVRFPGPRWITWPGQVKVGAALFAEYRWTGSTIEYHRSQIRKALKFRESARADEDALIEWLATEICPMVLTDEGVRAAMLARCRNMKIEPPGRPERILGGCRTRFERTFCEQVTGRLSAESTEALLELATGADGFLQELKSDPGRLGLESLLEEIVKLRRARAAWRMRRHRTAISCSPRWLVVQSTGRRSPSWRGSTTRRR